MANEKRKIEIFSAGCPCCEEMIAQIRKAACPSCEVTVLDTNQPDIAERARQLGVCSVPAVAIDGVLADCRAARGPDLEILREAGLGVPLS